MSIYYEKYLKYKNKYVELKRGGGKPPFEILVIGGGKSDLYSNGFYEVGNHPTSNFGNGKDWNNARFWEELDEELGELKFKSIIIDKGSGSWLHGIDFDKLCLIIIKHIYEEGVILIEDYEDGINEKIKGKLLELGFNNIGIVGVGANGVFDCYNILSLGSGEILPKDNLNRPGLERLIPDPTNKFGYPKTNPEFVWSPEKNQIEFIRNRLL